MIGRERRRAKVVFCRGAERAGQISFQKKLAFFSRLIIYLG